nr:hypothetical protein [Tanacetum cinerariifolium]
TGSPSVYLDTEPLKSNKELVFQLVEVTAYSGESPKLELFVVHPGSVAARIKDRKCKTRGGSSRPHVKRKLAPGSLTSRATSLPDVFELKDATAYHLKISAITPPAWKNYLDNHMDVELLDLHDRCYARQVVVDNTIHRRSRELLQFIKKLGGKFDVIRSRERSLLTFESKVTSLEAKKARLEDVEVSFRKEVEELKHDRREVVSKVVPYAAMEFVHSDDIGSLVGRLVSSAILYGRCRAYKQVADMKEPFDLSKVKGYHSSYKKDHTQASNNLATATFPWLDEFVADPSAPIEVLLSKKPPSLQRPVPLRTQVPFPTSQRATPSSASVSNLMSPPADASQSSLLHHLRSLTLPSTLILSRGGYFRKLSDGGSLRVIAYGYDGLHMLRVAPPPPDYIPGPEEPHTPPVPQDEDEREPMFIQPHDPDYVPQPIYPEYIPLEDKHVFPAEEQPLPPIVSPTAESPGHVVESDPKEYKDNEMEDGPADYPIDRGDDGDDDDGDSSRDDADDEDEDMDEEEEEEHLASADSTAVVHAIELVSSPEGTKPIVPPPSTYIATTGARITIRLQASTSFPPAAEVERLLAMSTPPPLPLISLSPPSAGEPSAQAFVDVVIAALPPPPLPPSLYIPPPVDRRDDILESEQPPRKRACLSTLGSSYEIRESSTRGRGVDYGFVSIIDAVIRRRGVGEVGYGIKDNWVDPAEAVPEDKDAGDVCGWGKGIIPWILEGSVVEIEEENGALVSAGKSMNSDLHSSLNCDRGVLFGILHIWSLG